MTASTSPLNADLVADYVAQKFFSNSDEISVLKLQKLLYYIDAWHLVFFDRPIINAEFEAWAHGPCIRSLFERFKHQEHLGLYDPIKKEHLHNGEDVFSKYIHKETDEHINGVLDSYGDLSGIELEILTHEEKPWQQARGSAGPFEKCNTIISKEIMKAYYKCLLEIDQMQ